MTDQIVINKLDVIDTIKEGVNVGLKNIVPILVNVLLFILTCWIPYLNVGTTIGLTVGLVSKVSRGEELSMTEIFDPKYRKYMGEFFLVLGLVAIGAVIGTALVIIPGIVIKLAWSLAPLLVVDKGKNPMEAISLSNNLTYGNKWRILGTYLLTNLAFIVLYIIFAAIGIIPLVVIVLIFQIFINIGVVGSVYRRLAGSV